MSAASLALAEAHRHTRAVTRTGSRSFYFASFALDGARRRGAYALYTFLRKADDAADAEASADARREALAGVHASLERCWSARPSDPPEAALAWAVQTFGIPREPIEALLDAMQGDLGRVRVADWASLERYCEGVAGTVGRAMAPLLGAPGAAIEAAASLGRGMQLTNILRDVREDLGMDRIYLPAQALQLAGVTEASLRAGTLDDAWRTVARRVADRARDHYADAEEGIRAIAPWRSRGAVRLMRAVYGEILREIERRDFDVFSERVVIPTRRKLWIAARVLGGHEEPWRAVPA